MIKNKNGKIIWSIFAWIGILLIIPSILAILSIPFLIIWSTWVVTLKVGLSGVFGIMVANFYGKIMKTVYDRLGV